MWFKKEHRIEGKFGQHFTYTCWRRIGCSIHEEAFPFYKVYAKQHFYEIVDAGHDPFGYDLQDLWLDVFQRPWAVPADRHKIIDDLARAVENGELFAYVEEEPFEWQAPGRFAGDEADASAPVNAPLQALIDEENDDRSFWQKTKDVSASVWESTKIAASESVDHPGEFGKGVLKGIGNLPADAWNLAVEQVKSNGTSANLYADALDREALEAYKQGDLEKANELADKSAGIHEFGRVDDPFPIENPAQQGGAIASALVPVGTFTKAGVASRAGKPLDVGKAPNSADSVAARRAYLNEKFDRTGDLNLDINIRGRQEVATNFFRSQGIPEGKIDSFFTGIDFTQPVEIQTIGSSKKLWQYQAPGAPQGNWYSLSPSVEPTQLGISPYGFNRAAQSVEPKVLNNYVTTEPVSVLRSTSAAVDDFWSVSGQSYPTTGGATQLFSPQKQSFILIPSN